MTTYRITHVTRYTYTTPVSVCQNVAHLRPRPAARQRCFASAITADPVPAVRDDRADYFGNPATYFTIQEPHTALTVTAASRVGVRPEPPPDPAATDPWEAVRKCGERQEMRNEECGIRDGNPDGNPAGGGSDNPHSAFRIPHWKEFAFDSRYAAAGAEYADYAAVSFRPGRPVLDAAVDLTRRIHTDFAYDPRATTVATPVRDVFAGRRGVCQDFAHLQIACLRSLGLAARYVSGYLSTVPEPGCPRLVGADASHAWVGVWCGAAGWVDLDPTNDQIIGDRHVTVAWGRDYDDVSPVKGIAVGGGRHTVSVGVDVEPEGDGGG